MVRFECFYFIIACIRVTVFAIHDDVDCHCPSQWVETWHIDYTEPVIIIPSHGLSIIIGLDHNHFYWMSVWANLSFTVAHGLSIFSRPTCDGRHNFLIWECIQYPMLLLIWLPSRSQTMTSSQTSILSFSLGQHNCCFHNLSGNDVSQPYVFVSNVGFLSTPSISILRRMFLIYLPDLNLI